MPELIEQEVSPGVVGLVADDDAVGVAGDDGGDSHLPQADCLGLPAFGGGAGQGQAAGWGAWCFSDWGSFSSLESIG